MAAITVDFQLCIIFILLWVFSLQCLSVFFFKKPKDSDLPPSPPSLPVIGHLHLLHSVPSHKTFEKLSSKYGPLLHLRAFNIPIVLVSSGSMAYEVFRTNDLNFTISCRDMYETVMHRILIYLREHAVVFGVFLSVIFLWSSFSSPSNW